MNIHAKSASLSPELQEFIDAEMRRAVITLYAEIAADCLQIEYETRQAASDQEVVDDAGA